MTLNEFLNKLSGEILNEWSFSAIKATRLLDKYGQYNLSGTDVKTNKIIKEKYGSKNNLMSIFFEKIGVDYKQDKKSLEKNLELNNKTLDRDFSPGNGANLMSIDWKDIVSYVETGTGLSERTINIFLSDLKHMQNTENL